MLKESYAKLHAYDEALKIKNPGTVFEINFEESKYLKYMFIALSASLRDFKSCQPMIIVDGTHLKGKYKGTMLVGVAIDNNNQLYPLAYAIVDNENDRALMWFTMNLKTVIGECLNLLFVSDRGQNIANVNVVFPNYYHKICTYYLKRNVEKYFKDESIKKFVSRCLQSISRIRVKCRWVQIVNYNDGLLARYLKDAYIQRWACCYQSGNRYNNMTNNSVECFNAIIKEARVLPITSLLEYIRDLLQCWFHERRTVWSNSTSIHSKYAEEIMGLKCDKAR
ncbi:uncharacterized protein LOC120071190 [Benincasa hispida]|uniref:uncharacterized protein LOC120067636 n=1 Tax=Benincasa hispida TaxID=102211 RepID=UPI0018FF3FDC|nr:uncharacterized protein LOC120067636 [Benincasa hispida]XP_038879238.1 uncharacterized protein LOC120071190 [Benincasa hispida]